MSGRLMQILTDAGDPRVLDKVCRFDRPPFSDPEPGKKKKK
jgi:hypothetical protein